uniref:Inositol polyphosphate phosphatase-like 1b n=1 Tax=Iconisemion striatum TaxID=60296 RepID=A0A1A7WZF5_9TELE
MEIDSLLCKISALVSLLSSLEKKVLKALQDAVTNHNLAAQPSPPPPDPTPAAVTPIRHKARQQPVHSFQVRMVRYGRQTVSVDVDSGVLLFDRKAGSFGIERVSHDRILQIIKFQNSPAKVQLVVDSYRNTPREMTFESARKCDSFCHLLLLLKSTHAQLNQPDLVSVFVGTWNMGGSPPPRSLQSWTTCCGLGHTPDESTALLPHDIYALGTQENPQGEREWTEHIKATLRSYTQVDFKLVAVQSLWNIRLAVVVKPEHESRISHVNTASCTDDIFTSDHSPVFATFQVGVTSQCNSRTADLSSSLERAWIELEAIDVIVKTASKAKFFIEFHSSCLEETQRSTENNSQSCDVPGFLKLGWSSKQLPKLFPVLSDMEYLQDQHLLLSVKSCDGFESYGECCVSLRSLTGASQKFETFLSHRGEEMGSIRGRVRVHVPKDRRATRRKIYELFCFDKEDKGLGKGHSSPAATRLPVTRPTGVPAKPTPSSYTNPAYFIFEGVSVPPRVEERLPQRRDPQVIWSGNEALQLPRVSVRHDFNRRSSRRSDFTEIEIPALPPQCAPTSDFQTSQTNSSYQLFPVQSPASVPPHSCNPIPQYQEQTSPLRDRHQGKNHVQDSVQPEGNMRYMNHSAIIKEKAQHDKHQLLPSKPNAVQASKTPSALPYTSSHSARCHSSASWIVDKRPLAPTGDNSLTALQIAKSLSEVDFFPSEERGQRAAMQRTTCRNGPLKQADRGYSWEKEVSVLKCAPETVQELLSTLGLQKYTLGLSLSGWDDLDYFSAITEEDLCAAGVTNPSHRRRILENLPRNWT